MWQIFKITFSQHQNRRVTFTDIKICQVITQRKDLMRTRKYSDKFSCQQESHFSPSFVGKSNRINYLLINKRDGVCEKNNEHKQDFHSFLFWCKLQASMPPSSCCFLLWMLSLLSPFLLLHYFLFLLLLYNSAAAAAKLLHRRQPTRLPHPWDSPGKNTGVGCHFLLQCMKVKSESEVAEFCPTLSDPMDCSPPGSSVHGIFQARVLE